MLCNFLTNNILGREGLLCPNGIKVKRFKHLMLLRLPSGHSRHAASSCSSSRWQSTYTAVITKLHLSNSVASWRYWRVYIKQENMERSMKLEDGLLSETVILSRDLSLLLKAIQTSAPHINNFPFLLHSLLAASVSLLSEWLQTLFLSGQPDVQWHATLRSQLLRAGVQMSGGRGVMRVG